MRQLDNQHAQSLAAEHGTPLLAIDCHELADRYAALKNALPGVDFYYAVKAFPNASVVNVLNSLGAGFDIATSGELKLMRKLHINPRRCIHTHPIKKDSEIRAALRFGATTFVVDNVAELEKFVPYRSRVGLLLRVSYRNPDAVVDLSKKFGCDLRNAPAILERARELGIRVKGLSFHVGSQSATATAQAQAVRACGDLIRAERLLGHSLDVLDIGGGFPVGYHGKPVEIEDFVRPLREALDELPEGLEVIAEPGRYLVASAVSGVFSVVGKANRGGQPWYYLDDGVYGSFSGIIYDHAHYPLRTVAAYQGGVQSSVVSGPTCDSIDVISEALELPELAIGDLLVGEMMGAYTAASASEFNSLNKAKIISLNEEAYLSQVYYIA